MVIVIASIISIDARLLSLPLNEVEKLEREIMAAAVMVDVKQAHQLGVRGVPFFVINDRLAFSGAHPPETILEVIQEAEKQAIEG